MVLYIVVPIVVLVVAVIVIRMLIRAFSSEQRKRREHEVVLAQAGGTDARKNKDAQVIKEKETILREVVMVPCKYCGALAPQSSLFCPNCGARRTA